MSENEHPRITLIASDDPMKAKIFLDGDEFPYEVWDAKAWFGLTGTTVTLEIPVSAVEFRKSGDHREFKER